MSLSFGDGATARVLLVMADGTQQEVECVAVHVLEAKEKLTLKPTPKPKEKKIYITPATDDDARDVIKGYLDGIPLTVKDKERLMGVLVHMRRRLFGAAAATWTPADIVLVGKALKGGTAPSDLAKAVASAARDEWWKDRGDISFPALVKNAGGLAARYQRKDHREVLRRLLPTMEKIDPIISTEISARLSSLGDEEAASIAISWQQKIRGMRNGTGES